MLNLAVFCSCMMGGDVSGVVGNCLKMSDTNWMSLL